MSETRKHIGYYLIPLFLAFFAYFFLYYNSLNDSQNQEKIKKRFVRAFERDQQELTEIADKLTLFSSLPKVKFWDKIDSLDLNSKNIFVFVFDHDSLLYWNTNEVLPLDLYRKISQSKESASGIEKIVFSWFHYYFHRDDHRSVVLLKLIQRTFPIHNKNFKNYKDRHYFGSFKISLTKDELLNDLAIIYRGKFLVGLKLQDYSVPSTVKSVLSVLYLFIFLWSAFLILKISENVFTRKSTGLRFVIFSFFYFIIYFLYQLLLPEYLVSNNVQRDYFNFSNDQSLILFSFILILTTYTHYRICKEKSIKRITPFVFHVFILFNILYALLSLFRIAYERTLQVNDVSTGFVFRYELYLIFYIIALTVSFFLLFLSFVRNTKKIRHFILIDFVITLVNVVILYFLDWNLSVLIASALIMMFTPVIIFYFPEKRTISFVRYLLMIILFSFSFSIIINQSYLIKKNKTQQAIAAQLSKKYDKSLEQKFVRLKQLIQSDIYLKQLLKDSLHETQIVDYVNKNYLDQSFDDYHTQITYCKENYWLEIKPEGRVISCSEFFGNIKRNAHVTNTDSTLFLIDHEIENTYYLGEISLKNDSIHHDNLYIEFFSSVIPVESGYPKILRNERKLAMIEDYALAQYEDGELVYQYGDFDYHGDFSFFENMKDSSFVLLRGYLHYKLTLPENKVLIVSRPAETFTDKMSAFSVLFVLLTISGLLIYVGFNSLEIFNYLKYSFRARLQIFFVFTLLSIFLLLAGITLYYFINTRKVVIIDQLNEKTKSVLMELEYNLNGRNFGAEDRTSLDEILHELSLVLYTDINLYDHNGFLLASSDMEVYQKGIFAPIIHPEGYKKIILENKLIFLNKESLGKTTFYSSYIPVNIESAGINGVLNLPYFAKQTKIRESFFKMLFNYLNLFVLIGILGTFIALMVSRFLTKPLTLLQNRLAETRLEGTNEPLVWQHDDEIGQLIQEYNHMVEKLEKSARLLKRSERENAWREIAQQIAHEIRNPLTPMKLNVQYLQRCYAGKDKNFDEKFKNLTTSLITQIEALNDVASMFSDLARAESSEMVLLDIVPLLRSSVLLYNNTSSVDVIFTTTLEKALVKAREPELLRVFNNLVKNAVQAVGDGEGRVEVILFEENNQYIVQVKDSGKGISEELKKKIFLPYFTTKSGGTGIGLAIVKNIITELGGSITFDSETGKGTVFTIRFNKTEENGEN